MELGSILEFLDNKSILVTGATGFLAKILVEKILRVQPNIKKLYLLVRAADAKSASQRLQNEMIGKELFRVIKEKQGTNLKTYMSQKVTPVAGDISADTNLGVQDLILVEEMVSQLDVIVNLAATTNFDDRYDVTLRLNTLGANNVLSFAKRCAKIQVLVHVSTAYVCGEKEGLILESPYKMGEALNGRPGLDVLAEQKIVEAALKDLRDQRASESEITVAMKDLGIKRAKLYGWPNTYVFTKAMGEMMIGEYKENIPVVVIRPTIVTSTYKEPIPGWVEGVRTIDSLAVGYAKGKLQCFLGDLKAIVDVIPADMVVNSILVAAAAHAKQPSDLNIYQIGSSVRNPVTYGDLQNYGKRYFTKKPWINKEGKPVIVGHVTVLDSMESFHRYMTLRYLLLLKGLELVNTTFCQYFKGMYMNMNRKITFVMRLVELYKPYLFFKGVFDDINAERLRMAAREGGVETDMFDFDTKKINWDDYFMNTHIPGVVKYVFK